MAADHALLGHIQQVGVESVAACPTAETLSTNLLSPNPLLVTWTLADLAARTCPAKRRERQRRIRLIAADTELRRLICEGFEQGIVGEKLAEAAGLSVSRVYQIRDGRR